MIVFKTHPARSFTMSEANQYNTVTGFFICIKSRYILGGGVKFKNADVLFRGGLEMLTVADMGEGGVKNG